MKTRVFVLLIGLFLLSPVLSGAGAYIGRSGVGDVEGFVYNSLTASRLMGVRVEAPGRGPLYTDHLGFFRIRDLPVGVTHLVFRLGEYVSQEEVFVVYENEKVYLAIFMWPAARCPEVRWLAYYPPPRLSIDMAYFRLSYPALDWWYGFYCPRRPYYYRYYHPFYRHPPRRYWGDCWCRSRWCRSCWCRSCWRRRRFFPGRYRHRHPPRRYWGDCWGRY